MITLLCLGTSFGISLSASLLALNSVLSFAWKCLYSNWVYVEFRVDGYFGTSVCPLASTVPGEMLPAASLLCKGVVFTPDSLRILYFSLVFSSFAVKCLDVFFVLNLCRVCRIFWIYSFMCFVSLACAPFSFPSPFGSLITSLLAVSAYPLSLVCSSLYF